MDNALKIRTSANGGIGEEPLKGDNYWSLSAEVKHKGDVCGNCQSRVFEKNGRTVHYPAQNINCQKEQTEDAVLIAPADYTVKKETVPMGWVSTSEMTLWPENTLYGALDKSTVRAVITTEDGHTVWTDFRRLQDGTYEVETTVSNPAGVENKVQVEMPA